MVMKQLVLISQEPRWASLHLQCDSVQSRKTTPSYFIPYHRLNSSTSWLQLHGQTMNDLNYPVDLGFSYWDQEEGQLQVRRYRSVPAPGISIFTQVSSQ
jgi:hypothetical protein